MNKKMKSYAVITLLLLSTVLVFFSAVPTVLAEGAGNYLLDYVTTQDDGGTYGDVYYDGTYIYTARGTSGVSVYTFDGADFTLVDTNATTGKNYLSIYANGTYIFSGTETDGLHAFTFDGTDIVYKDKETEGYNAGANEVRGVFANESYVFTGIQNEGIFAYSFDGTTITYIDNATTGHSVKKGIHGDDSYIFIAADPDNLMMYTFDGTTLTEEDKENLETGDSNGVFWDGTYAYDCVSTSVLRAYTTDGSSLTKVATDSAGKDCWDAWSADDGLVYIAGGDDDALLFEFDGSTFTLEDVSQPLGYGAYSTVFGGDDYVFFTGDGNGLSAYNRTSAVGPSVPTNSNPVPADEATGQELNPTLYIDVNHTNGSQMNVNWWTNATGTWTNWVDDNGVVNSTQDAVSTQMNEYSTTYWWSVNTTDAYGNWDNDTFWFTTRANSAPVNSIPVPADTATGIAFNPTLYINVTDDDGDAMIVYFRTNASGSWANLDIDNAVPNGTQSSPSSDMDTISTKYWWSVNTTDGTDWDNDTYSFTTTDNPWSGSWTDGWTIGAASCSWTGYLFGNWTKSEHVSDAPALEEEWTSANDSHWNISDDSAWWGGNYTYYASTTGVNHTFSVLNDSGTNRSQGFGWVHTNDTEVDVLFPYIIFAYTDSSDFDVITWTSLEAFIMHWDGTNMTDIATGDAIIDPTLDATDISDQWFGEGVYLNDEGNYYKYIYNELAGTIKFKWWGNGAFAEPDGWTVQYQHTNITHVGAKCHGIGLWNPYERETVMQWDLMNLWQLNYTTNASAWCNISGYNESRPHMNFPVIDLGTWTEEIMSYFNASAAGNLSVNTIRDIMRDNITNPMNMESRMFELKAPGTGQQNDTVYYYSMILDNFSAFSEETPYDEWLHLHVQMCPEEDVDTDEYGDIIVGIDVDNNRVWDANDRIYWAYADDDYNLWTIAINGEGDMIPTIFDAHIWESDSSAIGNLHRYNTHLNYVLNIPLADLVTSSSVPLNVSDIFGLSILTTISGDIFDEYPAVWQNWNETAEDTFLDEEDSIYDISNYFFGGSDEVEYFETNATSLGRWGEGEITGTMDASGTVSYNMSIESSFDDSYSTSSENYSLLNVSIDVTNTGAGDLTEIYLNVTWWNCSCSDLNMTFVSSNQDISNFTWYNDSCYIIIRNVSNEPLTPASTWNIWYIVNVTACPEVSTATDTVEITGNASELSEDVTVTGDDAPSFEWGYSPPSTDLDVDALALVVYAFIVIVVTLALIGLVIRWLGEVMR